MVAILLLLQDYPMPDVEKSLLKAAEARAVMEDTVRQFLILESAPELSHIGCLFDQHSHF
jgi:hypothetical protein